MSAMVTLQFVVGIGYLLGDYALLHSNNADRDIDWNDPVDNTIYELFPNAAGIYGWGKAPWGHSRWGRTHSERTPGWGHLFWGNSPWGSGATIIAAVYEVTICGEYKFAFACYDQFGNLHEGTPEEAELQIHIAPEAPTGLKKVSYNKTTDVLVLEAA